MPQVDFRPYYYNAMYDYTRTKNDEGIIIARPFSHQGGFAASVAKLNMGWCGDYSGNWKGIQDQLTDIYHSAQAGYGAIAMEVGGFYQGRSDKEQFTRYFQAGCMTACIGNWLPTSFLRWSMLIYTEVRCYASHRPSSGVIV